jgi:hypothetical protein
MQCQFCTREIKNNGSLKAHEMCCKLNPNKITRKRSPSAGAKKGCTPWNKGETKETNSSLAKQSVTMSERYANGELQPHRTPHSQETKDKLSRVAKERKLGGYVRGSGRGKKGWYKGYFCDSSWELAYVIYCLDHNISIERNTEIRQYIWNNNIKNYIPDFLVEDKLIEIKGYKTEEWLAKLSANPDVDVMYEKDMQPILSYVTQQYGKDFINLYK